MGRPRTHNKISGKFGRLLILKETAGTSYSRRFSCLCECGTKKTVNLNALLSGNTKSCGCLKSKMVTESNTTHGLSKSKLYRVWCSMRQRCTNKNDKAFANYGGRGISVCGEWSNYSLFYSWAFASGYAEGLTIERVDNDGIYSPGNCSWLPRSEQPKNRRPFKCTEKCTKTGRFIKV